MDVIATNETQAAMLHVRFNGRSVDVPFRDLSLGAVANLVTVCYLASYGSHSGRAGSAGKRPRSSRSVSSSSLEKCSPKSSRMLPT